jgi:excisionase family DNA binding protein
MMTSEQWSRELLCDILKRAVYDALGGDDDAAQWIATTGSMLAHKLGIIDDPQSARDWAEDPQVDGLTTSEMAELAGIPVHTVRHEIDAGRLLAVRMTSPRAHYIIPHDEARLWLRRQQMEQS